MATSRIPTSVRFPRETLVKLHYIAKKNHRSFNAQMEFLAESCIRRFEVENGPIPVEEDDLKDR